MYVDKDKNGKYSIMDISEEEMQLMDVAFSSKGRDCLDEAIFYGDSKSLSNDSIPGICSMIGSVSS